jgi:hypothetical protein
MPPWLRRTPPEEVVLFGREPEEAVITEMLLRTTEHGDALVVRGEPGIGKSSLLGAATAAACGHGFQVLTATGVQSEAELPFAGLHQLLRAVDWDRESLPRSSTRGNARSGKTSSPAPDLFIIALATLERTRQRVGLKWGIVNSVERSLGRTARPFRLDLRLLPVAGSYVRRLSAHRALLSLTMYRDRAAYGKWLTAVVEELA